MSEQRFVEMETRLAFQESTIQELNEIITHQQEQIDILQGAVQQLYERMKSMSEEGMRDPSTEPPPPHY